MTEQTTEIQSLLTEIKTGWGGVSALPAEFKGLREGTEKLATDLKDVRRQMASRPITAAPSRQGAVSDDCARHLASAFILHCERSDKLDALCSVCCGIRFGCQPGHCLENAMQMVGTQAALLRELMQRRNLLGVLNETT